MPIQWSSLLMITFFHTLPWHMPARFSFRLHASKVASKTVPLQSPLIPVTGFSLPPSIDLWTESASLSEGRLFRCVCRAGKCWGDGVTERVVWHVVKHYAKKLGMAKLPPHDLPRSCAKLSFSRRRA